MNVSSYKCATGDTQLTAYSCYGKGCGKKQEQQFKVHATKSKDYLGGGNQH